MTSPYRLYGAELSPYSLKVRAYLRFKGLAHEWVLRSQARGAEFARYAKLPLIPVLVGADDSVLQDSTPMIERLEGLHPEPAITPESPALAFLSALLEDYGDEWLNKAMFHYRWSYDADRLEAARRIVDTMLDGMEDQSAIDRPAIEAQVAERMTGRLGFVGSNPLTGPAIEESLERALALLEPHFAARPYLFGARPALADFGMAAQFQQMLSDPTPGPLIRDRAPRLAAWCARMMSPTVEGPFEPLDALAPTLTPFLVEEVADRYLPWMAANAEALMGAEDQRLDVELRGRRFEQVPQRYAAKAWGELRRKRALLADDPDLARLLGETGCDATLAPPTTPAAPDADANDDDAPPPVADAVGEPGED